MVSPQSLFRRAAGPLVLTLALAVVGCSDATGTATSSAPDSASSAAPSAPATVGAVDVFEIPVGACMAEAVLSGAAGEVDLIECGLPHQAEVFASTSLTGEWPGDEEAQRMAEAACYDEFGAFVGVPLEQSVHDFAYFYPTAESWRELGDRTITCVATSPEPRLGSLAGAAE